MEFPQIVTNDEEREVFRAFAYVHPSEAAEVNWPEFVKMAQEMNPAITEEALRQMLKRMDAQEETAGIRS